MKYFIPTASFMTALALLALGSSCSRRSTSSPTGALPASWYTQDDGPVVQPDAATDAAVRSLFRANTLALSKPSSDQETSGAAGGAVPWHLDGMIADFAVTTNGVLANLLSNGSYAVRGTWRHTTSPSFRSSARKNRQRAALTVTSSTTSADVARQLEPAIHAVLAAGLVQSQHEPDLRATLEREGERFLQFCRVLSALRLTEGWSVEGFEFQLTLNATGQVTPVVGVGGAFNLFFDWIEPVPGVQGGEASPAFENDTALSEFVRTFSSAIAHALDDTPTSLNDGLALQMATVGLGLGAQGDIGIAQTQEGVSGRINFRRDPTSPPNPNGVHALPPASSSILLIRQASNPAYAAREETFKVDAKKLSKGLAKAIAMGRYFVSRAKEADTAQWALTEIETEFDMSIGGDLKLTSLNGQGQVILDFDRLGP